jgi:hypothetical protein
VTDYPTGSPAAGWYADPADPSLERWWGGSQWTHETRPIPAPAPSFASVPGGGINPFAAMDASQPSSGFSTGVAASGRGATDFSAFNALGTSDFDTSRGSYDVSSSWYENNQRAYSAAQVSNGHATAGLVLGLVGVNLFAIIFSSIGLRRARDYERAGAPPVGRTRSRWGLGLGIAGIVLGLVLGAAVPLFIQGGSRLLVERVAEREGVSVGAVVVDANGFPVEYDRAIVEQALIEDFAEGDVVITDVVCSDDGRFLVGYGSSCEFVLDGVAHTIETTFITNDGGTEVAFDGLVYD